MAKMTRAETESFFRCLNTGPRQCARKVSALERSVVFFFSILENFQTGTLT